MKLGTFFLIKKITLISYGIIVFLSVVALWLMADYMELSRPGGDEIIYPIVPVSEAQPLPLPPKDEKRVVSPQEDKKRPPDDKKEDILLPSIPPLSGPAIILNDIPNIFDIAKNEEKLNFWLKKAGARMIMEKLLQDAGGGSVTDCHQEAHRAGRAAYAIFGAKAFEDGNASCHSGFYHGAMETFLYEEGTSNLAEKINRLCDVFDTYFGKFECLHGVGHGVIVFYDYDLPLALKTCRELATNYDAHSCYGGVFMENIITGQGLGAAGVHETKWVSKDPQYPCNSIDDDYNVQYQCYQMQTSWMLWLNSYNFSLVAGECKRVRPDMVSVCFKSYGRDAAGHTLRNNEKIVELCNKVPRESDYYQQCIIGALNVIVDFWGAGLHDQASGLCKLIDGNNEKQLCYSTLAARLGGLYNSSSDTARVCNTFEPQYQYLCSS